jgi:hypothetical protein
MRVAAACQLVIDLKLGAAARRASATSQHTTAVQEGGARGVCHALGVGGGTCFHSGYMGGGMSEDAVRVLAGALVKLSRQVQGALLVYIYIYVYVYAHTHTHTHTHTASFMVLYWCFTAVLLLLYCCFTAALLLLYGR